MPRPKSGQLRLATPAVSTTTRVALYRRASTDEGNQPYSLDAQNATLRRYVASQETWQVRAEYEERASGKDIAGRPELRRLLADAAAGRFDLVAVARLDRWARSLMDLLFTIDQLDKHGVQFASASEHFDTNTPVGRLILQIPGGFAEFERSLIIERIQRGNAAKIARGIPLTRNVAFGLKVDDEGVIVADPATIGVVRHIFATYAAGALGTKEIARHLNVDHMPSPRRRPWSPDSVSRVLSNRNYLGEIWHVDRWYPGAHAALLDQDQFDYVQRLMAERRKPSVASHRHGDYVLSGVITCRRCGGAYVGSSGTARNGQIHRYYMCLTGKRYGSATCDAPTLPADELEHLVTDALLEIYSDPALFDRAINTHQASHAALIEPLREQVDAVRAALAAKQRLLAKYRDDYEADRLSAVRYEARARELDEDVIAQTMRLAELEAQLAAPPVPSTPTADETADLRLHLIDALRNGDLAARKDLFSALVASLVVYDRDDIRPTFRLYGLDDGPDPTARHPG